MTASTGLKSKFNRLSRSATSRSQPSHRPQIPEDADSGATAPTRCSGETRRNGIFETISEHTALLTRPLQNADGRPLWEDDRSAVRWPASVAHTTWEVLASNYVNVFLVFVPLGIAAGIAHWNPTLIFVLNFLAIIPLASLLSFATEELSVKLGQTIGGLLNATFGNAIELIVRKPL